mgnify:CR=1 FL=1
MRRCIYFCDTTTVVSYAVLFAIASCQASLVLDD